MVGGLVKRMRVAKGLTQAELALKTGLRQTYISQVEAGEIRLPRDHNLDALGKALGVTRPEFYAAAGVLDLSTRESDDDDAPDDATAELLAEIERQLNQIPGLRAQLAQRKAERPKDYPGLLRSTAKHLGILAGSLLGEDDLGRES